MVHAVDHQIAGYIYATNPILVGSNVAASAPAVALVRVAGAARAVTMTRAVDLALDNDTVRVTAVMMGDEKSKDGSDEEENDVPMHD